MSRFVVRVLVGILVILVLLTGFGGALIWWKVSTLKERLVRDLGKALGARVEVSSLDLDFWSGELRCAGISLTNESPDAPWDKGAISQATVKFHLADLLNPTLPLNVEVSDWSVVLHPSSASPSGAADKNSPSSPGEADSASSPAGNRHRIQVTQLQATQGEVEIHLNGDKVVKIQGVSFTSSDNGAGVWTTELRASSVSGGDLEAGASSVQIRGDRDKLAFTNLRLPCGQGLITGDGEVALSDTHPAKVNLTATQLPVAMLLGTQWRMKFFGLVDGDVTYEGDDLARSAHGHFAVRQGKCNLLAGLGKILSLVGLPDIADVDLDKVTSDFTWKDGTLHLANLDLRKNDVARIAGTVDIDPKGQVDGKLKLGLPSTITAKWPPIQDKVFSVQLEDFNWAEVHVTGTPDHLQEDLTSRVLAVGLGQGGDLWNEAKQKAADWWKSYQQGK